MKNIIKCLILENNIIIFIAVAKEYIIEINNLGRNNAFYHQNGFMNYLCMKVISVKIPEYTCINLQKRIFMKQRIDQ